MDTKGLGMPKRKGCALIVIDIQESFRPVIHKMERVIRNTGKLIRACHILGIPVILTEQYPRGLGKTLPEISGLMPRVSPVEKTSFDCFGKEEFGKRLKELGVTDLILTGIESHVCVLKTALSARLNGYNVHAVTDALSSRRPGDHSSAVERMRQGGCFPVTTEMIMFQLLERSDQKEFSGIQSLVK